MSDQIKHECGIVLIRLLKPLQYYKDKYGSWRYGLDKLYLLMEKQHNRGQDGAGVVSLKLDQPSGMKYLFRERSNQKNSIQEVFANIYKNFEYESDHRPDLFEDPEWAKTNLPFAGELYMGHLRYGTFGNGSIEHAPVMRKTTGVRVPCAGRQLQPDQY